MNNIRELYVFGEPIDTELGEIYFLTLKEYPLLMNFTSYLSIQKFEIVNFLKSSNLEQEKLDYLSSLPFIDLIKQLKNDIELYQMFKTLFILCFRKDVFDNIITDEDFDFYRDLIKGMNNINTTPKNPNPEIEKFNNYKRIHDKSKGLDIDLESVVTSVWSLGINPFDLTIYQTYALFNRMIALKNYEASIIGSVLGGKLDSWFKPMTPTEKQEETLEEFEQDLKNMNLTN
jgi:hypothetical protein